MTEKPRDFGLSGVTDKLKHFPSESEAVIHNKDNLNTGLTEKGKSDTVESVAVSLDKDNLNTGLTEKGKSDTVESVAVSLDKDESEDMFDFRREALAKLDNPNVKVLQHAVETAKRSLGLGFTRRLYPRQRNTSGRLCPNTQPAMRQERSWKKSMRGDTRNWSRG